LIFLSLLTYRHLRLKNSYIIIQNNSIIVMKSALLLVLVAVVTSQLSKVHMSSRIVLYPGKRNVLEFASGQIDGPGKGKLVIGKVDYNYRFSGQPSWLQANGFTLAGNAPANASGSWPVRVNYIREDG
jgi:hypothetical protein